jgi:hypothetical protein
MNVLEKLKYCNPDGLAKIPMQLQTLTQTVTWQAGPIDPDTGKFAKYPKGKDGTGNGWPKPEQWVGNLKEAIELAKARGHSGVGVVLPAMIDGFHLASFDWDGVDFDDVERIEEIEHDWQALGNPYMEISPSGKGLRAFVKSKTPIKDASCARPSGGKDELFCSSKARWMTVTGNEWKPGGLPEATEAAMAISAKWNAGKAEPKNTSNTVTRALSNKRQMLSHLLKQGGFEWPQEPLKDGNDREFTMLRYAGHLRSRGNMSQGEIEELCLKANLEHYAEPLSDDVVLDRARRYVDKAETREAAAVDIWPALEPLPPKFRATPALDPELLPNALSGYVADCANRMRIPAEMIATPMIVALGSVFGKKVCVQPRSKDTNWLEYPNLWGVSILPPAMLKSPSLNAAMKFINELESQAQREHATAMAAWNSEERVRKVEIKLMEAKAKKALNIGDRMGAKQQLDQVNLVKPPVRKRQVISDATPEARLEILCDNPNGVMLVRDEFDGHLAQLKKDGYENARAQELQFFDGHQDYSDDRIKRGSHIAEGPRMALYGNLQPAKVEKYLMDMHKGGSDDGYLQRLLQLAVQPTITQDFELLDAAPDLEAENLARDLFKAAESMPLARNPETNRIKPRVLKFEQGAQEEFDEFLVALENMLRSGGISNPVIAAHFGKYRGTLPKLALILALAEDPFARSISLEAYRQALDLLLFYRDHAKRIYGVVSRCDLVSAYELVGRIKKGQLVDGFNPRDDIQRKEWQGLRTSGEVEAAIELLIKHNHLCVIEEATNGRPRRTVRIHPDLLRQKGAKVGS